MGGHRSKHQVNEAPLSERDVVALREENTKFRQMLNVTLGTLLEKGAMNTVLKSAPPVSTTQFEQLQSERFEKLQVQIQALQELQSKQSEQLLQILSGLAAQNDRLSTMELSMGPPDTLDLIESSVLAFGLPRLLVCIPILFLACSLHCSGIMSTFRRIGFPGLGKTLSVAWHDVVSVIACVKRRIARSPENDAKNISLEERRHSKPIFWADLTKHERDILTEMGVTRKQWNHYRDYTEDSVLRKKWAELSDKQESLAKELGFTQPIWDGINVMPKDLGWNDLQPMMMNVCRDLGVYTGEDWELPSSSTLMGRTTVGVAEVWSLSWKALSEKQKSAAQVLGYNSQCWPDGRKSALIVDARPPKRTISEHLDQYRKHCAIWLLCIWLISLLNVLGCFNRVLHTLIPLFFLLVLIVAAITILGKRIWEELIWVEQNVVVEIRHMGHHINAIFEMFFRHFHIAALEAPIEAMGHLEKSAVNAIKNLEESMAHAARAWVLPAASPQATASSSPPPQETTKSLHQHTRCGSGLKILSRASCDGRGNYSSCLGGALAAEVPANAAREPCAQR